VIFSRKCTKCYSVLIIPGNSNKNFNYYNNNNHSKNNNIKKRNVCFRFFFSTLRVLNLTLTGATNQAAGSSLCSATAYFRSLQLHTSARCNCILLLAASAYFRSLQLHTSACCILPAFHCMLLLAAIAYICSLQSYISARCNRMYLLAAIAYFYSPQLHISARCIFQLIAAGRQSNKPALILHSQFNFKRFYFTIVHLN
jgi:hypothetical protein